MKKHILVRAYIPGFPPDSYSIFSTSVRKDHLQEAGRLYNIVRSNNLTEATATSPHYMNCLIYDREQLLSTEEIEESGLFSGDDPPAAFLDEDPFNHDEYDCLDFVLRNAKMVVYDDGSFSWRGGDFESAYTMPIDIQDLIDHLSNS